MTIPALIGLGSNLGDRKATLVAAVAELGRSPGIEVRAVSSYHETPPVGGPGGQGAFLNAALLLDTSLGPETLLSRLQEIEREAGRVREVRWSERTLDLDILLFGDHVIGRRATGFPWHRSVHPLRVPHLLLPLRRFVLAPAAEIAPEMVDPVTRRSIASLLTNLDRRPSYVALFSEPNSDRRRRIFRRLISALSAAGLTQGRSGIDQVAGPSYRSQSSDRPHERRPAVREAIDRWASEAILSWGRELRADRWSEDLWGERWIATDFWFDALAIIRPLGSDRERFFRLRDEVIQPTFVVVPRPYHKDLHSSIEFETHVEWPIGGRGIPVLVPAAGDDEGLVAEVVTACAATRAGLAIAAGESASL